MEAGLSAKTVMGDAFSIGVKDEVIRVIREGMGQVDLVIYSLASPKRVDSVDETKVYHSVLKPLGGVFSGKTVNPLSGEVSEVCLESASEEELASTVKVMGGEDWTSWLCALKEAGVLSEGVRAVAYSYMGPALTRPIYRSGTIGKAKEDLESSLSLLNEEVLKDLGGRAFISINKALVTQASSAIPVLPLYIAILYRVMKTKGMHEGCIEQMHRLFSQKLRGGGGSVLLDEETGFIRLDEFEMRAEVQAEVSRIWKEVTDKNVFDVTDLRGYYKDFLSLYGFGYSNVDEDVAVEVDVSIEGLSMVGLR